MTVLTTLEPDADADADVDADPLEEAVLLNVADDGSHQTVDVYDSPNEFEVVTTVIGPSVDVVMLEEAELRLFPDVSLVGSTDAVDVVVAAELVSATHHRYCVVVFPWASVVTIVLLGATA